MSREFWNRHSLIDVLNLRYKVFFMESSAWLRTRSQWIVANQIVLGLFVPWKNFCKNNGNMPVCKKQPMLLFLFCHLLPCKIYNTSVQISVRSDPSSQLSHRWCTVVFMAATLKISFFPGGHSSWTLIENSKHWAYTLLWSPHGRSRSGKSILVMQWIGSEMMNWLGVSFKALNFYAEFPSAQGVIRFFISVYQSIWVHQKRAEK